MSEFDWAIETPSTPEKLTKDSWCIGLRVMLSEDSVFYGLYDDNNPIDVEGVCVGKFYTDMALGVEVLWGNGTRNSYNLVDLVVVV